MLAAASSGRALLGSSWQWCSRGVCVCVCMLTCTRVLHACCTLYCTVQDGASACFAPFWSAPHALPRCGNTRKRQQHLFKCQRVPCASAHGHRTRRALNLSTKSCARGQLLARVCPASFPGVLCGFWRMRRACLAGCCAVGALWAQHLCIACALTVACAPTCGGLILPLTILLVSCLPRPACIDPCMRLLPGTAASHLHSHHQRCAFEGCAGQRQAVRDAAALSCTPHHLSPLHCCGLACWMR
jgi:hypothetical protein